MMGARTDRPNPFRIRHPHDREIAALAIPALGALAADPLVSLVDTVFVGRLGVTPLAALGVNASIFSMAFVVFNFLAYGTTPMVARAVGRGDVAGAGKVAVEALTLAVTAGLVLLVVLQLFAVPIVEAMGARGELVESSLVYLRIRALASPAVLLITAGHGVFRGWHDTRTPLAVTLFLNVVNVVLDPILIFVAGWGLAGAAAATAVAQWVGAGCFLWLLLVRRREAMGVEARLPRPRELLPFLHVGGTLLARTSALIGTLTLATAVATRIGMVAVAAHQVASQLWLTLALVLDSLAVAGQAMVARYRGARDVVAARAASDRLLAWGLVIGVGMALVLLSLSPWLAPFFTDDPAAVAALGEILPFLAVMQPIVALVSVWDGILIGAEDFRYMAGHTIASAALAVVMLLLTLPFGWGLAGVWWGIVTLMLGRLVTLVARYWGIGIGAVLEAGGRA